MFPWVLWAFLANNWRERSHGNQAGQKLWLIWGPTICYWPVTVCVGGGGGSVLGWDWALNLWALILSPGRLCWTGVRLQDTSWGCRELLVRNLLTPTFVSERCECETACVTWCERKGETQEEDWVFLITIGGNCTKSIWGLCTISATICEYKIIKKKPHRHSKINGASTTDHILGRK